MKYGHEIDILRQRWDTLIGVEDQKWEASLTSITLEQMEPAIRLSVSSSGSQSANSGGRYKKGPWEDQLAWAYDFLTEDKLKKIEACYCNKENYLVQY